MGQAQVGGGGGEIQRLGFRAAAGRRVNGAGRAGRTKPLCSMQREQRPAALDLEQEKQRPARRDSGGAAQEVSGEAEDPGGGELPNGAPIHGVGKNLGRCHGSICCKQRRQVRNEGK